MTASLRALLGGTIDYAGLFPPAHLSLDQAIGNYARYRECPDTWMLGRFVCPAARLAELAPFADLFQSGPPFAFSALGRGGNTLKELLAGLRADLAAVDSFRDRHGAHVAVEVLEVRLPAGLHETSLREVGGAAPAGMQTFVEMPWGGDWRAALPRFLERLRDPSFGGRAGIKLRCGGLEASAFPSAEQVAFAVSAALRAGVPFKATAGLHHPLRRFDSGLQATMHGFVNLFLAGALTRWRRDFGEEQARAVLEDEAPAHFSFDDDGASWRDQRASTAEIAAARQEVLSFGSCSFDEPRDELRALGWL